MAICERCSKRVAYIDIGGEGICLDCFNEEMAEELGVKAERYPEGVALRDGEGQLRQFRLRKRLHTTGIIMEADEEKEGGYRFVVDGPLDVNQGELLLWLIAKAESGMAEQYMEQGHFPDGKSYHHIKDYRLAGWIDYDPGVERAPRLIVDGKPYTWQEVGEMLMAYEGFQVKIEVLEEAEEVNWEKK